VTERGTMFGYHNLVVDMRSLVVLRQSTGVPVIFDARTRSKGQQEKPE